MNMLTKYFSWFTPILFSLGVSTTLKAQSDYNPVLTSVPSLQISPDARSAGMGDQGVATSVDSYAQFWNPAKYAFSSSRSAISLSYTPWLRQLVNDIALMQVSGYYKLGNDDNQALGASLRYFTLGKLTHWGEAGESLGDAHPNEFAIDLSYSRKLSETFSMAVALRYLHSNPDATGVQQAGSAFAADISGYMHRYIITGDAEALWTAGFNIRNIGSKISFDGGTTSNFIPTNLSLGTGFLYPLDEFNTIGVNLEANKLLVPTPPRFSTDATEAERNKAMDTYYKTAPIAGIFKSFGDAPGGMSEELKEIRWAVGAEYNYNNRFFLRAGYNYLHPSKGNLQSFTLGAGFKLSALRIDTSYLISTVQNNPLDGTLRFSLAFDMEGIKNLFN